MPNWLIICSKQRRNTSDPDVFLQQQGICAKYCTQSLNHFLPTSRSSAGQSASAHHPRSLQRTRRADPRSPQTDEMWSPGGRWEAPSPLAADRGRYKSVRNNIWISSVQILALFITAEVLFTSHDPYSLFGHGRILPFPEPGSVEHLFLLKESSSSPPSPNAAPPKWSSEFSLKCIQNLLPNIA